MNREDILTEIKKIVSATVPDVTEDDVTEESTFGTLGLDSIKLVEIGVRAEQVFGDEVLLDDWIDQEIAQEEGKFSMKSLVEFIEEHHES